MTTNLFEPFKLNDTITLSNRIIMAPLTRCMADENLVPTQLMADYYARRADTGLIVSEATIIRPDGQGYPNTPGIFTPEQIAGWRQVTDAVHAQNGKIFAQLWHTGRLAHPYFFNNGDVLAPSAIGIDGSVPRQRELQYQTPKAADLDDIKQLIIDYRQAAINALEAGFDGVEIHGANGYLLDQFLHYSSNIRDDEFGGSAENMARFALAVIDAVINAIGGHRTALRLSPGGYHYIEENMKDAQVFDYLLSELNKRDLAYLHVGIFDDSMEFASLKSSASAYIRARYDNTLVGVGGYTAQSGSQAIAQGKFDLLAIGRPLIANPDYVQKVKTGEALTEYSDEMLAKLI
ncbi:alkene reductase [Thalassotalea aquiviva]|uniref:alkene reductase n=1 Tax=Thalassotalea aquiviva TaxID=3242415 RepID=UPI00352B69E6